ncbi:MAG: hypothetical protein KGO81_12910 [Bacteroidota bacterium]|nr:hypothetical protein [Bacteroidota bacterium]
MLGWKQSIAVAIVVVSCFHSVSFAQTQKTKKKQRKSEMYFSWGYNKEWYTHSTIRVMQPSLGNDYKLVGVTAHDRPGWNDGLFSKALSIPQYNYRLGFLVNRKKDLFFEINFDHTKYIFENQNVRIKGTFNGKATDAVVPFTDSTGSYYYLNNGANFLLFNLVKRWHIYESGNKNFRLDGLGKAGIGPVVPHVENSFFGQANDPHFQVGGWNVGFEGAVRATFFKYAYLEFANKVDYAGYSGLKIYQGKARQMFGTYEMILSIGVTLPTGKVIQ